jgi:DNA-binding XRE family transcriptional regulator
MASPLEARELPYQARARIADNLLLQRMRAGLSQEALGDRAMVSPDRIGVIENGQVNSLLDTHVRLVGSLSIRLDDLLAGVTWKPGSVELEYEASYVVEFDPPAISVP